MSREPTADPPDEIVASAVGLLTELCALSSPSGDAVGLQSVAERLGSELGRHGFAIEISLEPDADGLLQPLLVARGPGSGRAHLLCLGHLDTVLPAHAPRRQGDRLVATGALDMKGGLAAFVAALDLLALRGLALPADLVLVAVPDEETGGAISERATRRFSAGARAVLVLEPGERRGDSETLVAGRRGLLEWTLAVTGRAAHSGLAYWSGRSALAAAASWCARAQALSRPGPGVTVNVGRLLAGTPEFVDDLASHHDLLGTTRQRNVVADRARAEGEARFLSLAERDATVATLAELARQVAVEYEVAIDWSPGVTVPPVDPDGPGAPLIARAVELAAAAGWRIEIERDRGGISFPNFLPDPSAVVVVDGLGPVGDGMHTRDEWLDLGSLARRSRLLAELLATL